MIEQKKESYPSPNTELKVGYFMKKSIGFDVSKSTVDAAFFDGTTMDHFQVENSASGFLQILKKTSLDSTTELIFTMEATGVYHQRCAEFFSNRGYFVSVVNPLIIKRYADMRMSRAKTDKVDAQLIARYGWNEEPYAYRAPSENRCKIRAFLKVIASLQDAKTQNRNRLEALGQHARDMSEVATVFTDLNSHISARIKEIEKTICALVKEESAEEYDHLLSIPGVGKRLASAVVGYFGSLDDFESAKQLASFIGANPSPRSSGSSVRGHGTISRKGNSYLRRLFYLAALSAYKYNKSCMALYERLVTKGKAKKLALIAVANKLIRQVFAVVKYSRGYDPDFSPQS